MADLKDIIEEAAANPAEVETDSTRVKAHSLSELIKADQHVKLSESSNTGRRGIRFTKLLSPGTV